MQRELGVGVRGPRSLTPLLKPGLVRHSPCTFLIRTPIPLAHAVLEVEPVECQALPHEPTGGRHPSVEGVPKPLPGPGVQSLNASPQRDPDGPASTPSPSHAEATMASNAKRFVTLASRDFCRASVADTASATFPSSFAVKGQK